MTDFSKEVEEMLSLYDSFLKQIQEGYKKGIEIKSFERKFKGVILSGMGGSGVTGDYIRILGLNSKIDIPIEVVKGDTLPSWVSKDYLVVAISYSGNTHETLSCARQAYNIGASVIAITSGGKLEELAKKNGSPIVLIDKKYYPRTAIAELVSSTLGSLKSQNINLINDNEIKDAIESLRGTSRGEGLNIASNISDKNLYILSGCGPYELLANRWRQEFSENAKAIAKSELYPESAHNDIVVWQVEQMKNTAFILFAPDEKDKLCFILANLLEDIYRKQGSTLIKINPRGNNLFSKLIQGTLLAGYVSVYLAKLKGINPTDTSITGKYKESLEKANLN